MSRIPGDPEVTDDEDEMSRMILDNICSKTNFSVDSAAGFNELDMELFGYYRRHNNDWDQYRRPTIPRWNSDTANGCADFRG